MPGDHAGEQGSENTGQQTVDRTADEPAQQHGDMHGQQHAAGIGDAVERHGQNNAQRHAQRGQHQLFCVELRFCHKRSLSSQKKAAKTRPCFMRGACLRGFLVFMMMDARVCMQSRTAAGTPGRCAPSWRRFPVIIADDADAGKYFVRGASQANGVVSSVRSASACTAWALK